MKRFHVGEYIEEELEARDWSTYECACHTGRDMKARDLFQASLDIIIASAKAPEGHPALDVRLDEDTAEGLSEAFGTSHLLWLNLDRAYHEAITRDIT